MPFYTLISFAIQDVCNLRGLLMGKLLLTVCMSSASSAIVQCIIVISTVHTYIKCYQEAYTLMPPTFI